MPRSGKNKPSKRDEEKAVEEEYARKQRSIVGPLAWAVVVGVPFLTLAGTIIYSYFSRGTRNDLLRTLDPSQAPHHRIEK